MSDSTAYRLAPPPIRTKMLEDVPKDLTPPWQRWFQDQYTFTAQIVNDSTSLGGLKGATGVRGLNGSNGATGPQGITGIKGLGNFVEDALFPTIVADPILLWNTVDEALYAGITGINKWVQIGAGVEGSNGATGVAGVTGLANFIEEPTFPTIVKDPTLLWNTVDEALYAGITGINKWVQISAGTSPGATGTQGVTGILGVDGATGLSGAGDFIEDATFPVIVQDPVLLWNTVDEALYAGITGINKWVQVSAGTSAGATGVGADGVTGLQGPAGYPFLEDPLFPVIVVDPVLLWNTTDEALYAGITGINKWVQISAGTAPGSTGPEGYTGLQGIQGATGIEFQGATGIKGVTGPFGGPPGETGVAGPNLTGAVAVFSISTPIGTCPTGIMGQMSLSARSRFTGWTLLTDTTSTINVDIQKSSYASYPTMVSMHGSTGIYINSGVKNTGLIPGAAWFRGITGAQGDILRVVLNKTDNMASKVSLTFNYNHY